MADGLSDFTRRARDWLDKKPGSPTYGEVAEGLGHSLRTHSRAVGSAMRALHGAGLHRYYPRVVGAKMGKPGSVCDGKSP